MSFWFASGKGNKHPPKASWWWLNQPIWKNMLGKLDHFPKVWGENNKDLSCHHLEGDFNIVEWCFLFFTWLADGKSFDKHLLPNGGAKWWCFPWKITLNISKNSLLNITKNQWITLPWKWCVENHPQKGHSSQNLENQIPFCCDRFGSLLVSWECCWIAKDELGLLFQQSGYLEARCYCNSFWMFFCRSKISPAFGMMHSFSSKKNCKCSQTKLTNTPTDSHPSLFNF